MHGLPGGSEAQAAVAASTLHSAVQAVSDALNELQHRASLSTHRQQYRVSVDQAGLEGLLLVHDPGRGWNVTIFAKPQRDGAYEDSWHARESDLLEALEARGHRIDQCRVLQGGTA